MPSGSDWHRKLIEQMAVASDTRPLLIRRSTLENLLPYLGFRHLARHTYPFLFEWSRMRVLVRDLPFVLEQFRQDVWTFLEYDNQSESKCD